MLDGALSRVKLWRCARVGRGVRVWGRVWVHGGGLIELGDETLLDARQAPIELKAGPAGRLTLGAGCTVLGGASIEAEGRVRLGAGVRVGPYAKVLDTHFHELTGDRTTRPPAEAVQIDDGAVLEERAIVLPGVHIEAGAVVAARAVVGRRVPAGMRAVGNPARIAPR